MASERAPRKVDLIFFRNDAGGEPVRNWLREMGEADRHAIGSDLLRAQWRWPVGMPLCRPMGKGLWEVRTDLPGNRTSRVLICFYQGCLVALHGFIKKTRATPEDDLALASQVAEGAGTMSKKNMGSSIDDFLKKENIFEEAQAQAIKEVVAWQLAKAMKKKKISRARMAVLLKTSRSQVDRIVDPKRDITLGSLQRAAALVGQRLVVELV